MVTHQLGFVTIMEPGNLEYQTDLLIESIRRLPSLRACPIYAVQPRRGAAPSQRSLTIMADHDVQFIAADLNRSWRNHGPMNKVYAGAYIESLVERMVDTLVFLDSDLLFVDAVDELVLRDGEVAAAKPVDFRVLGQPVDQPITPYWEMIYQNCGVEEPPSWQVTTSIDRRPILPYFNDGVVAVRPTAGIFRRWRENVERLARDERARRFQPNTDPFLFLDQAMFAGTLLAQLSRDQIRLLDRRYNYTLVSRSAPAELRINRLDEVAIVHYHKSLYSMDWMQDIDVPAPLATWLQSRLPLKRRHRRFINLTAGLRKAVRTRRETARNEVGGAVPQRLLGS